MSASLSPEMQIIERMRVPGRSHIYVLGCFENRITFYTQQVRALNLVFGFRRGLKPDAAIAVVGSGSGGLTAAAAAAHCGFQVSVFEQKGSILPMLARSYSRWLHPHIYEWPREGSEVPAAGLPFLDWDHGRADTVVDSVRKKWERIAATFGIPVHCSALELGLHSLPDGRHMLSWNGEEDTPFHEGKPWGKRPGRRLGLEAFDAVILAVGFGREISSDTFPEVKSYWDEDNLDKEDYYVKRDTKRVLVSGTGDGGLIDALRLSFDDFRHEIILERLQKEWFSSGDLKTVREKLVEIEQTALRRRDAGEAWKEELNLAYHQLANELAPRKKIKLRGNIQTFLTGRAALPLGIEAAALNRFLFSLTNTEYIPGPLVNVNVHKLNGKKSYTATFANGREEEFDDVVIRHGPASALEESFPEVWKECEQMRASARATADPTREPLYGDFYEHLGELVVTGDVSNLPGPSAEEVEVATMRLRVVREAVPAALSGYLSDLIRWLSVPESLHYGRAFQEVYVPLQLIRVKTKEGIAPPSPRSRDSSSAEVAGDQSLAEKAVAAELLESDPVHCVILGGPGSGKTMLLKHLALRKAQSEQVFPVYCDLRSIRLDRDNLLNVIFERSIRRTPSEMISALRQHYKNSLAQGRVAFFLDGLDELPSGAAGPLYQLLEDFLASSLSQNTLLITARRSITWRAPANMDVYEIAPLNAEQRSLLVQRLAPGPIEAAQLARWLTTNPEAEALASVPFFIHFWLQHLASGKGLPDLASSSLLTFSRTEIGTQETVISVLEPLAYRRLTSGTHSFGLDQIEEIAAQKISDPATAASVAKSVCDSFWIAQLPDGTFAFAHRFFEELFAAQGLARHAHPLPQIVKLAEDPNISQGSVPAMTIAFLGDSREAFDLLDDLPESLDVVHLRIQARTLRYIQDVPADQVIRLASKLRELIFRDDFCGEETLVQVAANFSSGRDNVAQLLVNALTEPLGHPETRVRRRAIIALASLRSPLALAPITGMLGDPDRDIREQAAFALGETGDAQAVPALLSAYMQDAGTLVFRVALNAIVRIGGRSAVSSLVEILADRSNYRNLRWPVAAALGELRDESAFETLREALADEAEVIRQHAAEALGRLGNRRAVADLRICILDAEPGVRGAAAEALGEPRIYFNICELFRISSAPKVITENTRGLDFEHWTNRKAL
jgi:HEAT repeat protein